MTQLEQSQSLYRLSRSAAAWTQDGVNRYLGGKGSMQDLQEHIKIAKQTLDELLTMAAKPVERE